MPKRIRQNEDIYIAPNILGKYENGRYFAIDEKNNNEELNPNDIDDKITIYERQVKGWFLDRATRLVNGEYNGFIVLMICMSYLEGVEQYRQGQSSNGDSNNTFRRALNRMYPNQYEDNDLRSLYIESRVGLFHDGMVRGNVIINNSFPSSLLFENGNIKISPKKLLDDIKGDFKQYIKDLRNLENEELRNNFNNMFTLI
jgi:hypothetical protein